MKDLKKIHIPTLITCDRYDEATPETMTIAKKELPHGQLIIFEHSGHMSHIEEKSKKSISSNKGRIISIAGALLYTLEYANGRLLAGIRKISFSYHVLL